MFKSENPMAESLMSDIRARHPGPARGAASRTRGWRCSTAASATSSARARTPRSSGAPADLVSDAFLAQALYRLKAYLQRRGVPALPRLAHRLAMLSGQVAIGDPVVIHPGLHLLHGQVVIDGVVEIHPGVVIGPFVTIGLRPGDIAGPTIERDVQIGTGAKVLGRVRVGAGASIAANAVVLDDVPPGATVVGAPGAPDFGLGSHKLC